MGQPESVRKPDSAQPGYSGLQLFKHLHPPALLGHAQQVTGVALPCDSLLVKRQQEKHRSVTVGQAPVLTARESKQEQVTVCPVPPASLSARVLLDPSHSGGTELAPLWSPARDATATSSLPITSPS